MSKNSNDASEQQTRNRRSKRFWKLTGVFILIAGLFVLLIPTWDSIAVESLRCEVVSASPNTNSGGSRGSASSAGVLVETSNCGTISVSNGVSFENQQEIASSFEVGKDYEFDIGWFSRVVMKDLRNGIPAARDYRLVR
ncbi:hypothetical protein ACIQTW_09375 [Paenarthrobacter sp. NPDC090517]|uniref:hypothetical protein n=1 Tax=Paenarthrobacter sp. NPDC090517 TaxID=3364381 RepID=UPI0038260209